MSTRGRSHCPAMRSSQALRVEAPDGLSMPPRIRIGGLGGVWGVGRSASMVMMRLSSIGSALPAHRTGAYRSLGGQTPLWAAFALDLAGLKNRV